jgi:hypothetical protein
MDSPNIYHRSGKAQFSSLHVEKVEGSLDGRQNWRLIAPLRFLLGFDGECENIGGINVEIPAGFVTDFASVPRLLWPLFPPTGPWCEAAVIHDYLCRHQGCSRFLADAMFREAMHLLGVPVWRRVLMYYAVRFYGCFYVPDGV